MVTPEELLLALLTEFSSPAVETGDTALEVLRGVEEAFEEKEIKKGKCAYVKGM